jgi:3-hydroxyacyl-CoA dehydrogenase
MLARGLLGDKTGRGFYKKLKGKDGDESEFLTLDLATFEYRARQRAAFPSLDMARNVDDLRERVKILFQARDRAGEFYRKLLSDVFHYTAMRVPEIADDIVSIDNAMKWGFGWELGPFELWSVLGVESFVEEWVREKHPIPPFVQQLRATGKTSFYLENDGTISRFDHASASFRPLLAFYGPALFSSLKSQKKEIKKNAGASLIDLGDGVLCLEFHSKMNTIGGDTIQMVHAGLKALSENFDAMVIGNQAANFSVGANLMLILTAIQEGDWDEIDHAVRAFQNANMALKYAAKPVVAAPFGMTLGGGTEMCLHTTRVRAAAETYMGLVEAGVGLIPAGGGTKEMVLRALEGVPSDPDADPFTYVKEVFLNIGMAKVSTSAEEARRLRYLSPQDSISMNRDRQIADAKQLALDLIRLGHRAGQPRQDIRALGQSAFTKMKLGLHLMRRAEHISDHDVVVGTQLAKVLSGGGEFTSPQLVSEQYLLDLEREAFLSLCGQKKTVERIQSTLKRGKPLRN